MEEIWRDIKGYEGLYQVSNLGRVKSLERIVSNNHLVKEKILKVLKSTTTPYEFIQIKHKSLFIHRLVAETFIPNPDNLSQVNHKDENIHNNNVDNLEWCSAKYNANYGTRNERRSQKQYKYPQQYTLDEVFIKQYNSLSEAEKETGCKKGNISACCLGKYKTCGGFKWRYA